MTFKYVFSCILLISLNSFGAVPKKQLSQSEEILKTMGTLKCVAAANQLNMMLPAMAQTIASVYSSSQRFLAKNAAPEQTINPPITDDEILQADMDVFFLKIKGPALLESLKNLKHCITK